LSSLRPTPSKTGDVHSRKQQNNNAQPPSAARKARQPYTFSPQHLTGLNISNRDGGDEQDDEKGGHHRDEYRWADGERGFFQVSTGAIVRFRCCLRRGGEPVKGCSSVLNAG
jgi:hypothetical protein